MWRTVFTGFVVTACVITGCSNKDSDTGSTAPPNPALPDAVKPRPTTQQLQERVKLDLKYDPFSLMVPPTWELKSLSEGTVVVLEGDTPTDTVGISLPIARVITSDPNVSATMKMAALETTAKADAAKYPDLIKSDVVRDIAGARLIEQFTLGNRSVATQPDAATDPDSAQVVQWIFTVCVPSARGITAYDLRFTGLTLKVFKADQAFLRSIIDTLTYTPPAVDPLLK